MRHRKRQFKIGRRPDHVRSLLANQVCSLINEGRIQTTVTRAKETRRLAEKMVTLAKGGSLHERRRAIARLHQVGSVRKLFDELAEGFASRNGGYTRITRIGPRIGDGADMCYLEWVREEVGSNKKRKKATAAPTNQPSSSTVTSSDSTQNADPVADAAEPVETAIDAAEEAPAAAVDGDDDTAAVAEVEDAVTESTEANATGDDSSVEDDEGKKPDASA